MNKTTIMTIVTASFVTASCFNIEPQQYIDGEEVVNDESSAKVTLVGAYSKLQTSEAIFMLTMNYASDNVILNSSSIVVPEITSGGPSGFDPTHGGGYDYFYEGINVVNTIIDQLPKIDDGKFTSGSKSQIMGEAYFLRAMNYFSLARTYGGVPIVLAPSTSSTSSDGIKKSTYDQTLEQVASDLSAAESLVGSGTSDRTIATLWAVYALRARLELYRKNYEKAEEYSSKLIDNKDFSLDSDDDIFEIVFSSSDKNPIYTYYLPASYGGRLDYIPNPTLSVDLLDSSKGGSRANLVGENPSASGTYFVAEYASQDGSSSLHPLRIAEQYLIRSEARVLKSSSDIEGALSDLNAIKAKAGVATVSGLSKDDILEQIADERRLELAFEGHRYSDVIRTGKAAEIFGAYDSFFTNSNHWVLPFPYNAIVADPDLEQNPDY